MTKRTILYLFLISLFLFSGCSKQPEDMSTVRPNLILKIFRLVRTRKHDEAIVQVQKLRELDPTNSLFPVLEETEKNNKDLKKINAILRSGRNYSQIPPLLDNVTRQRVFEDKTFLKSIESLNAMLRMQELVDIIIAPNPTFDKQKKFCPASKVLKDSINEFNRLATKWKAPESLRLKVNSRLNKIPGLQAEERIRKVQSLELLAPGLKSSSYQTMMALSLYASEEGTKKK